MTDKANILHGLVDTITARVGADPSDSYTARLLADAPELPARKLGEEALETVIAALSQDAASLTAEAADLIYHLLVVLVARGVTLDSVLDELARREGISGLAEKAARQNMETE